MQPLRRTSSVGSRPVLRNAAHSSATLLTPAEGRQRRSRHLNTATKNGMNGPHEQSSCDEKKKKKKQDGVYCQAS